MELKTYNVLNVIKTTHKKRRPQPPLNYRYLSILIL